MIRSIEFLDSLEVSILSQRRGKHPPYGLLGGEPGATGKNRFTPAGDSPHLLPGNVQLVAKAGDLLTIETPGGGGYGTPIDRDFS